MTVTGQRCWFHQVNGWFTCMLMFPFRHRQLQLKTLFPFHWRTGDESSMWSGALMIRGDDRGGCWWRWCTGDDSHKRVNRWGGAVLADTAANVIICEEVSADGGGCCCCCRLTTNRWGNDWGWRWGYSRVGATTTVQVKRTRTRWSAVEVRIYQKKKNGKYVLCMNLMADENHVVRQCTNDPSYVNLLLPCKKKIFHKF